MIAPSPNCLLIALIAKSSVLLSRLDASASGVERVGVFEAILYLLVEVETDVEELAAHFCGKQALMSFCSPILPTDSSVGLIAKMRDWVGFFVLRQDSDCNCGEVVLLPHPDMTLPINGSHSLPPGLLYSRAAGLAVGVFLIVWALASVHRWSLYAGSTLLLVCAGTAIVFGCLLLIPWRRVTASRIWLPLFIALCIAAVGFTFASIADMMFQYMLAADLQTKPGPPALQGMLIFLTLLQVPTVFFLRHPELLD